MIPVGKLTLNKNPENYFAEVEQIAFSPAHMIPGIEPSPDKMLHVGIFHLDQFGHHQTYLQIDVSELVKVMDD